MKNHLKENKLIVQFHREIMESMTYCLNKYINVITEELHLFLEYYLTQSYGITFSFNTSSLRNDLICYLEGKNLDENKILIKNLKEKEKLDFRTTIYLFFQIYPKEKETKDDIKFNFFQNYLSELTSLSLILNQYLRERRSCNDLIERFLQNIYFVFKYIDKDIPKNFDKNKFFEINKYMKILMLQNVSSKSVYQFHNESQVSSSFSGIFSDNRKDDLIHIICSELKQKHKDKKSNDIIDSREKESEA